MNGSLITFDAIVTDVLADGKCVVRLENGHQIVADPAIPYSKMPGAGEPVLVEISSDDATATRLVFRRVLDVRGGDK